VRRSATSTLLPTGATAARRHRPRAVTGPGAPARRCGRSLADVAVVGEADVLASGADALDALDAALDDFLFLTAAALVGIGARALEIGVEYVKDRKAWGVPIGSFQAVAHRLADSAAAIDDAVDEQRMVLLTGGENTILSRK
jgi:alkylation response protein AidB-like acyl-CoA dehydrogenase